MRGDAPLGPDIDLINALLARARRLAGRGAAGADPKMRLLDVGTGHGRDLSYFARMKDVDAYGIDTADGFLEMLRERQRCETIPRWRVLGMDMRHLAFKDETFDIVRHNATLLHLPLIGPGYGVDEALAETYRILRPNGVLYALVKAGDGMAIFDTREGLGPRFFQFFSERTLEECVCRNGFEACEITRHSSQRAGRLIEWLSITAQRAGNIAPGG
ncbi:MAG: class I SAM-dependent methyltransferase [Candidatus Solibacter sp.]|nr:class I SAM-dependent methyltransferase [Candidatus Solibacter sp.]